MSVRSPVGTLSGGLVALTMAEGGLPLGVAWMHPWHVEVPRLGV